MTPFQVHIPDAAIDDLRARLAAIRWPDPETVDGAGQGVPLAAARHLADHWLRRHDWRAFEARLNRHPQFRVSVDGLDLHVIHVRSSHPGALPVLLTHGWPGSVVEFLACIGPLVDPTAHGGDPSDAFDVVIPSLPGFGFSGRPAVPGWNAERIARAWAVLMRRMGYARWVAQGGDWGSLVTHRLGQLCPQGLIAAHVNLPLVFPSTAPTDPTPEERRAFEGLAQVSDGDGGAYARLQGGRPQTLGYGLADSPIAQAAWIYEKLDAWTDPRGARPALSIDAMLDDIALYWFTNTAASSARLYWEVFRTGFSGYSAGRVELPMGASLFPGEFFQPPRAWAEQAWPNLYYWNRVDRGGHFAAWEQPDLFVAELRRAFRGFR